MLSETEKKILDESEDFQAGRASGLNILAEHSHNIRTSFKDEIKDYGPDDIFAKFRELEFNSNDRYLCTIDYYKAKCLVERFEQWVDENP